MKEQTMTESEAIKQASTQAVIEAAKAMVVTTTELSKEGRRIVRSIGQTNKWNKHTYLIKVKEQPTIALLDTRANTSFIKFFFKSLPQKSKLLKSHIHKVMSAIGANLGPIAHCHLTLMLDNKSFTKNGS